MDKVFDAECVSVIKLYTYQGGSSGFRIPIYQRPYDWNKDHLNRLLEDILTGLQWCSTEIDSLSFLGTVIIVGPSDDAEPRFGGQSFDIIDGQQRLTTICLLTTELYTQIKETYDSIDQKPLDSDTVKWLNSEHSSCLNTLIKCVFGSLEDGANYIRFPRLIRQDEDERGGFQPDRRDFKSSIGNYLIQFIEYINSGSNGKFKAVYDKSDESFSKLIENVKHLRKALLFKDDSAELTVDPPDLQLLGSPNTLTSLFSKFPIDYDKQKLIIDSMEKDANFQRICQLLLISYFLLERVQITLVNTAKEKYAFDIFDSLNTTGEPLTAIETFKPQVIKYTQGEHKYRGSESEIMLVDIESYVNSKDGEQRRKRVQDLVISYALYYSGDKLSKSLDAQRRKLRNDYESAGDDSNARQQVVRSIWEMMDYRRTFWSGNLMGQLAGYSDHQKILVCLSFIRSMNMTITLPLLTRYYRRSVEINSFALFADVVKEVTTFIILRRALTGSTASIDADFRRLMKEPVIGKLLWSPLCVKQTVATELPDVAKLAEALKELLIQSKVGFENKAVWVSRAKANPLYKNSKTLVRFMLLLAFHRSRVSKNSILMKKERSSSETDYLNLNSWESDSLSTIEHIAPENKTKANPGDWAGVYDLPTTPHTIGNLTLLPQSANSQISNSNWATKRAYYKLYTAKNQQELSEILSEIDRQDIQINQSIRDFLENTTKSQHLPSAVAIRNTNKWTQKEIDVRGENICELVWSELTDWNSQLIANLEDL